MDKKMQIWKVNTSDDDILQWWQQQEAEKNFDQLN